ncbi:MAG: hypothetical protein LBJ31_00800 [Treponema sp.]|jgi:hypothetical protein|nr:hypothetical protein [Treponema sp.]
MNIHPADKRFFLKKIPAVFWAVMFCTGVSAIDWPTREGTLAANFGSSDGGVPSMGDNFAADGPVYPADVGQLVFFHDPSNKASAFPSPLGAWAAVDHGDNLVGIYGRFEDPAGGEITPIVGKETAIAAAGMSGWTGQPGFYFSLYDRRDRKWINPAIIISTREDPRPPVIHQVTLRNTAGTLFNPALVSRLPQGLYSVFVDADDGEMLAPNRIICSVNGFETAVLSFETLSARDGEFLINRNGLIPASQVYSDLGFGLGELRLSRGQLNLVIEARDIAENFRQASYRLTIE